MKFYMQKPKAKGLSLTLIVVERRFLDYVESYEALRAIPY